VISVEGIFLEPTKARSVFQDLALFLRVISLGDNKLNPGFSVTFGLSAIIAFYSISLDIVFLRFFVVIIAFYSIDRILDLLFGSSWLSSLFTA